MRKQKKFTPNSILDVKQYIFCDSNDGLVLSDPRFVKIFKSCQKVLKSFDLSFKKDVPYFKMSLDWCPHCGTRHVVKYGFTKRTLVFKEIGKTKVKVQRYICKRCSKTFQTDLTSLVDKNSNFTNELKSESEHLISDYLGSLKNVCKSFKKILWNHSFHIKQLKIGFLLMKTFFRIWFRALLGLLCLWCRMAKNQRRMEISSHIAWFRIKLHCSRCNLRYWRWNNCWKVFKRIHSK